MIYQIKINQLAETWNYRQNTLDIFHVSAIILISQRNLAYFSNLTYKGFKTMKQTFVIASMNGNLRSGALLDSTLEKLKADVTVEKCEYAEDFLNALANEETAIFIPKNEEEIMQLFDETNIFSLSYSMVLSLQANYLNANTHK